MRRINKKPFVIAIAAAVIFVAAALLINIMFIKTPMSNRVFSSLSELDSIDEYVSEDLEYDSSIEPDLNVILSREAHSVEYEGKTYKIYAYELDNTESAKKVFHTVTGRESERNYGSYANFESDLPIIKYHNNCLYMLFFENNGYKETVRFVNMMSEPFKYDNDSAKENSEESN